MRPSWAMLGPCWAILGPSWDNLWPSCGLLGPSCSPRAKTLIFPSVFNDFKGFLKPCWAILGPSWAHLGACLKPSWALLGPCWGHVGPSRGHLWAILGPSRSLLRPAWGLLGPVGATRCQEGVWGRLGRVWGHFFPPTIPMRMRDFAGVTRKNGEAGRASLYIINSRGWRPPSQSTPDLSRAGPPPFHKLKTPLRESWEARARLRARRGGGYELLYAASCVYGPVDSRSH